MATKLYYTRSGEQFDLRDPRSGSIKIDDVAWSLSMVCRYGGHTPEHYSVAEHSLHVLRVGLIMVDDRDPEFAGRRDVVARALLLHDAHETYVGDATSPLKEAVPELAALDVLWERAVLGSFGVTLSPREEDLVRLADEVVKRVELYEFYPSLRGTAEPPPFYERAKPAYYTREQAREAFTQNFILSGNSCAHL